MNRKRIMDILGPDCDPDTVSRLLDAFHEENLSDRNQMKQEKDRAEAAEGELREAKARIEKMESETQKLAQKDDEIAGYLEQIDQLKKDKAMGEIDHYETMKLTLAGAFDVDICKKALDYDRDRIKSSDDYSIIDDAISSQIENKAFLFHSKPAAEDPKGPDSPQPEPKKNHYEPRKGSGDEKETESLGSRMAKEIMRGSCFVIK